MRILEPGGVYFFTLENVCIMVFCHDLPEVVISCLIVMLLYLLEPITGSYSPTITAGNGKRRTFICAGIAAKFRIVQERAGQTRVTIKCFV